MSGIDEFWDLIKMTGACVGDPRPPFPSPVERQLQGELASEVAQGEAPPEPMSPLSPTVRLVQKGRDRYLLYAVESVLADGFWSLGVVDVGFLLHESLPWAIILLDHGNPHGYWLTSEQVRQEAAHWRLMILPTGNRYELIAPEDIVGAATLNSLEQLTTLIQRLCVPAITGRAAAQG